MTKFEIANWLLKEEENYTALAQKMEETAFFEQPHAEKWSAAQHTQHLVEVSAAVAGALRDTAALRERFGTANKPHRPIIENEQIYKNELAQYKAAGKLPYRNIEVSGDRTALLTSLTAVNEKLTHRMAAIEDHDLDTLQMPHPVLGLMTVREMGEFVAYHLHYHFEIVEKY